MSKIKVLVVFANPHTTPSLRLGAEDRAIQQAIRRSRYRENIELMRCHAATVHDLRQALLDDEFQIAHISGHGINQGLVLEDERGNEYLVPQKALAALFKVYRPPLQCIILNACYSLSQGRVISLSVPFTIAMEGTIDDEAAIEFTRGFYDAIGAGRPIDFAYGEGCRSVALTLPNAQFLSKMLRQRTKRARNVDLQPVVATPTAPREPLLVSQVELVDASLDPDDSPYEQYIEAGKKKIRYTWPPTDKRDS